jgi:secreted PhoX family phosphatase
VTTAVNKASDDNKSAKNKLRPPEALPVSPKGAEITGCETGKAININIQHPSGENTKMADEHRLPSTRAAEWPTGYGAASVPALATIRSA